MAGKSVVIESLERITDDFGVVVSRVKDRWLVSICMSRASDHVLIWRFDQEHIGAACSLIFRSMFEPEDGSIVRLSDDAFQTAMELIGRIGYPFLYADEE